VEGVTRLAAVDDPGNTGGWRVFLSHTSELRDFPRGASYVAAAERAVSAAGHVIVDMAGFPAAGLPAAQLCAEWVRGCDVYVGMLGTRYGSPVRERPEVSYTELEFEAATEAGRPRLVFLLDTNADDVQIPLSMLIDREFGARQDAFRGRVRDSGLVTGSFASPAELGQLVERSLRDLAGSRPRAFRDRLHDAGIMTADVASPGRLEVELPHALQDGGPGGAARVLASSAGGLPVPPDLVGRDGEVSALVAAWLAVPPEPVAVRGAPGIGKSAVCLAALHDARVRDRFGPRRWFVRCDGAGSADAVLAGIAVAAGVSAEGAAGRLADRVDAVLGAGPGVLVLDNFETPWTADPLSVEALLRRVAAIPGVAVAVSVRGMARPARLRWGDFAMLGPLGLPEARRLFLAVAGAGFAADPGLDGLVAAVDGVPLAVELLGFAAEGEPDLAGVAQRWQQERAGVLERMGGGSRELSVPVSVEASLASPLMTAAARRLFGLLGKLPDGIARGDLPALLPEHGLAAATVLRRLGLVFDEGPRLRMLAPVREHAAAAHPPWPEDLARASAHYAKLAATGGQLGWGQGAQVAARLQAETGNMAVMLRQSASGQRIDELIEGVGGLVRYAELTGAAPPSPGLLAAAEQAVAEHGSPRRQADTWITLANLARDRSDYDQAQARYEQAIALYRQVGDALWEAHSVGGLADVALGRGDYDTARTRYQQTLALYRRVGDPRGQGNAIVRLSDIALERSDYDTARAGYEQALALYRQIQDDWGQDVLGQANSIKGLGDTARATADHDTAQTRYEQALTLYRQAGDVRGEARCSSSLGDIALNRSDLDGARSRYEQALALYQAIPDPCSAGWTLVSLARLDPPGSERARHWSAARQAWTSTGREDLVESVSAEFE
jgi:tetratricopeptide (TPR) repeat protein